MNAETELTNLLNYISELALHNKKLSTAISPTKIPLKRLFKPGVFAIADKFSEDVKHTHTMELSQLSEYAMLDLVNCFYRKYYPESFICAFKTPKRSNADKMCCDIVLLFQPITRDIEHYDLEGIVEYLKNYWIFKTSNSKFIKKEKLKKLDQFLNSISDIRVYTMDVKLGSDLKRIMHRTSKSELLSGLIGGEAREGYTLVYIQSCIGYPYSDVFEGKMSMPEDKFVNKLARYLELPRLAYMEPDDV